MSLDGPNFLRNIGETQEERDILSPLTDELEQAQVTTTETPPADGSTPPTPPTPPADGTPPETPPTPPTPPTNPDGTPDAGATPPAPPAPETPPTPPAPDANAPKKIVYGDKEFATVEEFNAYMKQIENSVDKVEKNGGAQDEETKKRIAAFKSTPVIQTKLPLAESYYVDDGNGGKTFQMDEYMKDVTNSLILGIQSSLVDGPLAAVQFGILKHALVSEMNQASDEAQVDANAQKTTNQIYADFPILKTNPKLESIVAKTIAGDTAERRSKAEAEKKDYVPATYDEIKSLITDILANSSTTTTQTVDPVEKLNSTPPLSGKETRTKSDPVMDDIDAMMDQKKKQDPNVPTALGNFSF